MNFEEAKVAAQAYFEQRGVTGLASALEAENCWIFYGGKAGVTVCGIPGVKVSKETGELSVFILPNKENFAILKSAKKIEL